MPATSFPMVLLGRYPHPVHVSAIFWIANALRHQVRPSSLPILTGCSYRAQRSSQLPCLAELWYRRLSSIRGRSDAFCHITGRLVYFEEETSMLHGNKLVTKAETHSCSSAGIHPSADGARKAGSVRLRAPEVLCGLGSIRTVESSSIHRLTVRWGSLRKE